MTKQIGTYTATGSPEWCEFVRFVIEDLDDGEIFLWPPYSIVGFAAKYPQHVHMLNNL
jgi:hypothetical protein